jgi:hypothetical protein
MGKAKSFIVPARMNMNAATMRRMLCSCGAHADHRESIRETNNVC